MVIATDKLFFPPSTSVPLNDSKRLWLAAAVGLQSERNPKRFRATATSKRHQKEISITDTLGSKQRHRFPRDYPGRLNGWRPVDIGRARRSFITGKNCSTLSARESNPRVCGLAFPGRKSRTKEASSTANGPNGPTEINLSPPAGLNRIYFHGRNFSRSGAAGSYRSRS